MYELKFKPTKSSRRSNKKALAVDFDGVIHAYTKGWQDGSIYDKPQDGAHAAMHQLVDAGFRVVIFTTRKPLEAVERWLDDNDIPYHEITDKKPLALAYIDDRAVRHTSWQNTLEQLEVLNILNEGIDNE